MEQLLKGMYPKGKSKGRVRAIHYPKGVAKRPVLLDNLVYVKLTVSWNAITLVFRMVTIGPLTNSPPSLADRVRHGGHCSYRSYLEQEGGCSAGGMSLSTFALREPYTTE